MILGPRGDHSIRSSILLLLFAVTIFCSFGSAQAEPLELKTQIEEAKRIHFVHARLLEEILKLNEQYAQDPNFSQHAEIENFISENLRMLTAPLEEVVHYIDEQSASVSEPRTEEGSWKMALIFSVLRARQDLGNFSDLLIETRSKILGLRAQFSADPLYVKTLDGKVIYSEEDIKDFYRSFFFSGAAEQSGVKGFAELGIHDLLDSIEWSSDQDGQYSKVVLEAFDAFVDSGIFDVPSNLEFDQFIVKLGEMRGRLGVLLLVLQKKERLTDFLRSHIVLKVFSRWLAAVNSYNLIDVRSAFMAVESDGLVYLTNNKRILSAEEFHGLAENGLNFIALSGSPALPSEYRDWVRSSIREMSSSIRSVDELIQTMEFGITDMSGFGFKPNEQIHSSIQAFKVNLISEELSSALVSTKTLDDFGSLLKAVAAESEWSRISMYLGITLEKFPTEKFSFETQLAFFINFMSGNALKELGQNLLVAKLKKGFSMNREEALQFLPIAHEAVKQSALLDLLNELKADPSKETIKIKIGKAQALRSKIISCLHLVAGLVISPNP